MRRHATLAALIFFAIAQLACIPKALAAGPTVKKLAEGVWAFVGESGGANSGFIVTDDGVVVVDSQGPKALALLLKRKIREVTDKPVVYVINTHYHGDHTFGNQYFPEANAIIAHENSRRAMIKRDAEQRERFTRFFGPGSLKGFVLTPPGVTFARRLTMHEGGRTIELVYAGVKAHTDGDVFVVLPKEKVVFAGDVLYNNRLPVLDDGDTSGALSALERLSATHARIFVPGHGDVTGPKGVASYAGYLKALRTEVKRLKDAGKTLEEVKKEIRLPLYSAYLNYRRWLPANAAVVYKELQAQEKK